MSHRLHTVAAAVALTAVTTAQAFALTTSQVAFTAPHHPQLQISCYTRVFFSPTSSQIFSRRCDGGEKPGSVKVIYHG